MNLEPEPNKDIMDDLIKHKICDDPYKQDKTLDKCLLCSRTDNLETDNLMGTSYCPEHGGRCAKCGELLTIEALIELWGKLYCEKCISRAMAEKINRWFHDDNQLASKPDKGR